MLEHALGAQDRILIESGIPNAENATSFLRHHSILDIDHAREGDRNLEQLAHAQKRLQILEGAYFTSGTFRSLIQHALPA